MATQHCRRPGYNTLLRREDCGTLGLEGDVTVWLRALGTRRMLHCLQARDNPGV